VRRQILDKNLRNNRHYNDDDYSHNNSNMNRTDRRSRSEERAGNVTVYKSTDLNLQEVIFLYQMQN